MFRSYSLFVIVFIIQANIAQASLLTINPSSVTLSDKNRTTQIDIKIEDLPSPGYLFKVSQDLTPGVINQQTDTIELLPSNPGYPLDRTVKVALNYPFLSETPGGEFQSQETENRVVMGRETEARSSYSPCYLSSNSPAAQSCKPLSFVIQDDKDAIPFVTYHASIRLEVSTPGHQEEPVYATVSISYQKESVPIGISYGTAAYSRAGDGILSLNKSNGYRAEQGLCVHSPFALWHKKFEVQLNGTSDGSTFVLEKVDGNHDQVPYYASLSFSDYKNYKNYPPTSQWDGPGWLQTTCRDNNLWLEVKALKKNIQTSPPGKYQDTLTVTVRAK